MCKYLVCVFCLCIFLCVCCVVCVWFVLLFLVCGAVRACLLCVGMFPVFGLVVRVVSAFALYVACLFVLLV